MLISPLPEQDFSALIPALSNLLIDCVEAGASIGFLSPLTVDEATAYWRDLQADISDGTCLIWVVREGDNILGTVQLALATRKNARNRAEVQKLMVASDARRRGIAAQLMQAVESRARQEQRGLLFLDTEQDSPAEAFYQSLGYQRVGVIPDFACSPQGDLRGTAIYYKLIGARDTQA